MDWEFYVVDVSIPLLGVTSSGSSIYLYMSFLTIYLLSDIATKIKVLPKLFALAIDYVSLSFKEFLVVGLTPQILMVFQLFYYF